jgi:hypothetical protein
MSSSFNREPLSSSESSANDFDSQSEQQQNVAVAISQKEFLSEGERKLLLQKACNISTFPNK